MLKLYYSLIYPQLLNGDIIWAHTNQSALRPLELIQKSIIRTIMNRPRYFPTNNDFLNLNILKLSDINLFSGCVFTFKSLNNLIFPNNYFFYQNNNRYATRNITLQSPFFRSTQSQSSPSCYCCSFWNNLSSEIR